VDPVGREGRAEERTWQTLTLAVALRNKRSIAWRMCSSTTGSKETNSDDYVAEIDTDCFSPRDILRKYSERGFGRFELRISRRGTSWSHQSVKVYAV
jgi:hypothetical protein